MCTSNNGFDEDLFIERFEALRKGVTKEDPEPYKPLYTYESLSDAILDKTQIYISPGQLNNYGSRKRFCKPTTEKLVGLAKFFNVSIDYLLGLTDTKSTEATEQLMNKKYSLSDVAMKNLSEWKKSDSKSQNFSNFKILQKIMEDKEFLNDLTTYFCNYFDLYPSFSGIKDQQKLKMETRNIIAGLNMAFEEFAERTYNSLVENPSFDRRLLKSSPYPKWKAYNFKEDSQS